MLQTQVKDWPEALFGTGALHGFSVGATQRDNTL
jgi:hypothetical protein